MAAPEEVIVGPADVYWSPVGEARPGLNETPGGNWELVVASDRMGEKGVILRAPRTATDINSVGSITPIKVVNTSAGFEVEFDSMDSRVEPVALGAGIDPDDIEDVAAGGGNGGYSEITLPTSPIPFQASLLIRFPSPHLADGVAEYYVPVANQIGTMEAGFTKDGATMITHIWRAVNTAAGWVKYRAQTSAVSP